MISCGGEVGDELTMAKGGHQTQGVEVSGGQDMEVRCTGTKSRRH